MHICMYQYCSTNIFKLLKEKLMWDLVLDFHILAMIIEYFIYF